MSDAATVISEETETPKSESGLLLDSLEIENFRCFRHLVIPKLGRVNLITGKNNVGKSTLLEALQIFSDSGSPVVIRKILSNRGQFKTLSSRIIDSDQFSDENFNMLNDSNFEGIYKLFENQDTPVLKISSQNIIQEISIKWFIESVSTNGSKFRETIEGNPNSLPYIESKSSINNHDVVRIKISDLMKVDLFKGNRFRRFFCHLLGTSGAEDYQLEHFWENSIRSGNKDTVIHGLSFFDVRIRDIIFIGGSEFDRFRIPYILTEDSMFPEPISVMGEGMKRMLGLSLAFANARGGILLIDEIENGIHYLLHEKVWGFIMQCSKKFDVQVFITTHSWDCIEAFQRVAAEDDDSNSGMLIRLAEKNDNIIATSFDEEDLEIITRQGIEVR